MFPRNENRNEGTFGCSSGTKTGTRVCSRVLPGTKTQAVLDGVPPTGLQLLRLERVLLVL